MNFKDILDENFLDGVTYHDAKLAHDALHAEVKRTSDELNKFPKDAMGMTPDHVKNTKEFKSAKSNFDKAFQKSRNFNAHFVKKFKKEYSADREAERASKLNMQKESETTCTVKELLEMRVRNFTVASALSKQHDANFKGSLAKAADADIEHHKEEIESLKLAISKNPDWASSMLPKMKARLAHHQERLADLTKEKQ